MITTTEHTLAGTSPAAASSAAGSVVIYGLAGCDAITVVGALLGATGGTLDVYLQTSHDGGTTWYDYAHFTQLASGAAAIKQTFHQSRASTLAVTTVGTGTTFALGAGVVAGGSWGNCMRLGFTAGVDTSAGAVQTITIRGHKAS